MKNIQQIKQLAISGGGIKGIAFVSTLYELDKKGLLNNLEKVSGTSIGSFIAACLVSGMKPKELLDILFHYDLSILRDFDMKNMFKSKSILKGIKIKQFFTTILEKKIDPNITLQNFFEHTGIEFISVACCLNTATIEYISYKKFPELTLIESIMMSTAIPIIFPPIKYKHKLYVDGGMINNFPIDILDMSSEYTYGITIKNNYYNNDDQEELNLFSYLKLILTFWYNHSKHKENNNKQIKNILWLDFKNVNISIVDFNISLDQKFELIKIGQNFL